MAVNPQRRPVRLDQRRQVRDEGCRHGIAPEPRMDRVPVHGVVADHHGRSGKGHREGLGDAGLRPVMQQRRLLRPESQPGLLLPADQAVVVHAAGAGVHHRGLVGLTEDRVVGPQRGADEADAAEHDA